MACRLAVLGATLVLLISGVVALDIQVNTPPDADPATADAFSAETIVATAGGIGSSLIPDPSE